RRIRGMADASGPALPAPQPARTRAAAATRAESRGAARASPSRRRSRARAQSGSDAGGRQRSARAASVETRLAELRRRLAEIVDLKRAGALLRWDRATYMPS